MKAIPLPLDFVRRSIEAMRDRAALFYAEIDRRRTVRQFSDEPLPRDLIEVPLWAAGCAPSGANQHP